MLEEREKHFEQFTTFWRKKKNLGLLLHTKVTLWRKKSLSLKECTQCDIYNSDKIFNFMLIINLILHLDLWLQRKGQQSKELGRLIWVSSACATPLPEGPSFADSQALGTEKGRLLNCSVYPAREHLTILLKLFTSLWWKIISLLKLRKNTRIYAVKPQSTFKSKCSPWHVRETLSMPGGETHKQCCKIYIKHGFSLSQILMQMHFSFSST